MIGQRVSRPEMIGILCGSAVAVALTGAVMMFNVLPALTTPSFVLDRPARASARTVRFRPKERTVPATKQAVAALLTASKATVTPAPTVALPALVPTTAARPQEAVATATTPATPIAPATADVSATAEGTPPPVPRERPVIVAAAPAQDSDSAKADTQANAAPAKSMQGEGVTGATAATAITITYAKSSPNAEASALQLIAALKDEGFDNIETNAVDNPIDGNQVAFFHAGDKDEADKLKALATGVRDSHGRHRGYDIKDATDGADVPAPGHIEIRLKGG